MISVLDESTRVPSMDESILEINPGDRWPLPYRGSRYSVRHIEKGLKLCWSRMGVVVCSDNLPSGLLMAMKEYKGDTRGSIRITPFREIITKRQCGESVWEPIYLGKLEGEMKFQGFDLNPEIIETGRIWRGFHFTHGEEFAVWNRDGNENYLYWTTRGLYFRSIERYPEICNKLREIRPRCGRLYVTEYGHIWMNLPGNEVSSEWAIKFKRLLEIDKQLLRENDVLLKSVHERVDATKTFPIYLGHISEFDSGNPPRTHFSFGAQFGRGGEDVEDGDRFDGDHWRKMRRDE